MKELLTSRRYILETSVETIQQELWIWWFIASLQFCCILLIFLINSIFLSRRSSQCCWKTSKSKPKRKIDRNCFNRIKNIFEIFYHIQLESHYISRLKINSYKIIKYQRFNKYDIGIANTICYLPPQPTIKPLIRCRSSQQ